MSIQTSCIKRQQSVPIRTSGVGEFTAPTTDSLVGSPIVTALRVVPTILPSKSVPFPSTAHKPEQHTTLYPHFSAVWGAALAAASMAAAISIAVSPQQFPKIPRE